MSIMNDIFTGSSPRKTGELTGLVGSDPTQVWLLYINYSVAVVCASEVKAQAEADKLMALYPGPWERTSGNIRQWFKRSTGNYVEIVAYDVQA